MTAARSPVICRPASLASLTTRSSERLVNSAVVSPSPTAPPAIWNM